MTDKELLELAAKATNLSLYHNPNNWDEWQFSNGTVWNPLANDDDEARLECNLGLGVVWYPMCVEVGGYKEWFKSHPDKQTARRRAGVIAAAELAK